MSSEKKNFELDRRSLLKNILVGTGLGTSGLMNTFLTNMMINFMQKGNAHAAGVDPAFEDFKFISFVASGGLPRFYWDLPLQPNGNDTLVKTPMIATKFNPDGSSFYSSTKVGNYYMPHIWNSRIPTVNGTAPMTDIAKHMLTMRGVDMIIESHEIDLIRQVAPVDGAASLTGLAADAASTPIPAVGYEGGGGYYSSEKGIAYLELGIPNPLTAALSPFSPDKSMLSLNNGAIETAIDQALLRMQASAANKSRFIPSSFAARFNAKKMMTKQFGNLLQEHNTLVQKYTSLITRSLAPSNDLKLVGVEDIAFPGTGAARQAVSPSDRFTGSNILSITDEDSKIWALAEGMAISEFMIVNGLSSSINTVSSSIYDNKIQKSYSVEDKKTTSNYGMQYLHDAHFYGGDIQLIVYTRFYRALSACLNELINKLKAVKTSGGSLFDKTVIAVTSEFNRIPRKDETGSDHGYSGSNYTIFTGMVNELTVVGNILSADINKLGTWGDAGPLPELNGRPMVIGNAASTVANLLEIKSPTPNDMSVTIKDNGKAKLAIKSLKNVA